MGLRKGSVTDHHHHRLFLQSLGQGGARVKIFFEKMPLWLPFQFWNIQRHFEKGTCPKLDSKVLSSGAVEDVVADRKLAVFLSVDMQTMRVHTFVKRLTCFTDVHGITSCTKHDIDDILAPTS